MSARLKFLFMVLVLATAHAGAQESSSVRTPAGNAGGQSSPPAGAPSAQSSQPGTANAASSQDENANAPKSGEEPAPAEVKIQPDTTPLNSPQDLTLGQEGGGFGRNLLTPSFRFSQAVNHTSAGGGSDTQGIATLTGDVGLQHSWRRVNLGLHLTAGGQIYFNNSDYNSNFQSLDFSLSFRIQRWTLMLTDTGSYLPESAFGFGGMANFDIGNVTGGISNFYLPNQSILTSGSRFSNSVIGTAQRPLGRRASVHFSGTWGILRFQSGALQNNNQYSFGGGLDYQLTPRDTLGFGYGYTLFEYGGNAQTLHTHSVNVSYGRRLTGRMSLQLSGGTQLLSFDNSLLTSNDLNPSWNLRAGITYAFSRNTLSATYMRTATSGSGVFGGADTNQVNVGLSRRLTRQWMGSFEGGYARNSTLYNAAVAYTFDSGYFGVSLSRPIGRQMDMFIRYNLQHQVSNAAVCIGCSTGFDRNFFAIGLGWHPRPVSLGGY